MAYDSAFFCSAGGRYHTTGLVAGGSWSCANALFAGASGLDRLGGKSTNLVVMAVRHAVRIAGVYPDFFAKEHGLPWSNQSSDWFDQGNRHRLYAAVLAAYRRGKGAPETLPIWQYNAETDRGKWALQSLTNTGVLVRFIRPGNGYMGWGQKISGERA